MSDLNQCNFIGRLGSDPDVRFAPDGGAIANVSIACNWKSKDKEGTEWVRLVFFGRSAEVLSEFTRKGSKVFISGRLTERKWTDKDGQDRYTTEVVVKDFKMLDSRPT